MKVCSKCGQEKESSEFYVRKKGKRAGELYNHCKICLRIRGKAYYQNNHDRQLRLSIERRRRNRISQRKFVDSLKDKPCTDCGKKYPPYVMDFDHRDAHNKKGNIASLVSQTFFTKERLLEEISKCDLVCANCHRIRTYKEKLG